MQTINAEERKMEIIKAIEINLGMHFNNALENALKKEAEAAGYGSLLFTSPKPRMDDGEIDLMQQVVKGFGEEYFGVGGRDYSSLACIAERTGAGFLSVMRPQPYTYRHMMMGAVTPPIDFRGLFSRVKGAKLIVDLTGRDIDAVIEGISYGFIDDRFRKEFKRIDGVVYSVDCESEASEIIAYRKRIAPLVGDCKIYVTGFDSMASKERAKAMKHIDGQII